MLILNIFPGTGKHIHNSIVLKIPPSEFSREVKIEMAPDRNSAGKYIYREDRARLGISAPAEIIIERSDCVRFTVQHPEEGGGK